MILDSIMENWAEFFTDPETQKAISWLGGGLAAIGAAAWTVIKYFYPKEESKPPAAVPQNSVSSSKVTADGGGTAVGGNVSISGPTINQGPNRFSIIALALAVVGVIVLSLAFAGNNVTAINGGVAIGGDASESQVQTDNQSIEK
ncbi:hypothetical protein [Donghicola mangrovi]|uniref:Uncharacterized protein n=1 Tax=Donghicola mangrovi TaxID=2729614 RepID=A0A850QDC5_9RHOB|nr:hypothetical protein [Donghicola mangrovi]NVO24890.1 hypothetical protein [Donghicola mangrovi]